MIDVIIEDEGWLEALPDVTALADACAQAAGRYEPAAKKEMALLLTNDATVQTLNRRFRNKDKPTNVLSFPAGERPDFLGDIALAREICISEASTRKIILRDHAAHLIIHAILHLVGYDHETDDEADAMERREVEILKSIGVANPYADAMETI